MRWGKRRTFFRRIQGRLIKAGSKRFTGIFTCIRTASETPRSGFQWPFKLLPEAGQVPQVCRLHAAHGRHKRAGHPSGARFPAEDGFTSGLQQPAVLTAFSSRIFHTLGKAQCVEAVYPDVNPDSARPGPGAAKTIPISCVEQLSFRLEHCAPIPMPMMPPRYCRPARCCEASQPGTTIPTIIRMRLNPPRTGREAGNGRLTR